MLTRDKKSSRKTDHVSKVSTTGLDPESTAGFHAGRGHTSRQSQAPHYLCKWESCTGSVFCRAIVLFYSLAPTPDDDSWTRRLMPLSRASLTATIAVLHRPTTSQHSSRIVRQRWCVGNFWKVSSGYKVKYFKDTFWQCHCEEYFLWILQITPSPPLPFLLPLSPPLLFPL